MSKTSETVVFFGNERLATGVTSSAPTLRALINANYKIACVITNYPEVQSRHRRHLEVIEVAQEHGIPVWLPEKLTEVKDKLESIGATIGVLAAYGKLVPQNIIDLFPHGIINIHPSLLPKHRGPTPIESVILNGETISGVSLMKLSSQLDAGPLLTHKEIVIGHDESKQSLADKLIQLGADMLIESLPNVFRGDVKVTPQMDSDATYDRLIEKSDGSINWQKSAVQLEREIRAYLDWPKSRCVLDNNTFIITAAKIIDSEPNRKYSVGVPIKLTRNTFGIQTAHGILEIISLKPDGKPEMSSQAWLAGYGRYLRLAS